jgi:uncharacterized membrane protein YvbJ
MARCERCGKDGCPEGSILCRACRTDLTYVYVTKQEMKKTDRSVKGRMRAWWWPIDPEDKVRHRRNTIIVATTVALILAALFIFRPAGRIPAAVEADVTGVVVWDFLIR